MKIQPINDYILMEIDTQAEKTDSGLEIPVSEGGRTEAVALRAKIIELPKNFTGSKDIKVGARVLTAKWEGYKTQLNGVNYLITKEKDILGILRE